MERHRIEYIDILRGFCIFLVTFGHLLEKGGYHGGTVFQFIYSFHMPLFMAISGFVMSFSFERKFANKVLSLSNMIAFISNKFKRIMIPYYIWALFAVPFFFYCYDGSLCYEYRLRSVFISNTSYWFLPCLFGLSVVFIIYKFILSRVPSNVFVKVVTLISLLAILQGIYKVSHYDFLRSISSYYIPFFLGVFMAEYKRVYNAICSNSKIYIFCLLAFCLLVGLFITPTNDLLAKLVRFACGLFAIPVCFNFVSHLKMPEMVSRRISYVGQNTLIIYILQFSFMPGLISIPDMNPFLQIIYFSVLSVLLICLILVISKIFERSSVLSILFLGK